MKQCTFYYFIVAQIDFICDKNNILQEYSILDNRVQKIFQTKSYKENLLSNTLTLSKIYSKKEYFIWNEEYIKFLEKTYKIKNFNRSISDLFEVDQEKVVFKLKKSNIIYNADVHKNDALKYLSEIGNTYFIYKYTETKELKEFKSYYNRFKHRISINESDPRLNYLFRMHFLIKNEIYEFQDFYNIKSFYGVII